MKFALFLVLSLSAVAIAGPAFNTKNNQINQQQQQQQQQQTYMTGNDAKSAAIDTLKQWCFSSQMSQQELTASFKKLVGVVKSSPVDTATESAVMGERICQGALVQKSQQTGQTYGQTGADAKAHELIKDVYMDALISCKSRECTQQLLKVISSQQVDAIRASYYMTRIAVTDKQSMKDEQEVKQFAESFIQQQPQQQQSEAVERQKLFATTALIGKWIQEKPSDSQIKQIAQKVAQTIVERYVRELSEQELEQYKQTEQPSAELAKKVAKRSAALKALANIPGHVLKQNQECEQTIVELAKNKDELVTVRQSAIECLEQNDKQVQLLKQITFDQDEPTEVRVAAYRALMSATYQPEEASEANKEQMAQQIIEQIVKHCEEQRNQQQDDQFVLYAVSHLDNVRTSQQPEHQAIKAAISKNKQHFMQIQVLARKFKQQLSDVRRSSRNYKLEQEFNQLESGLVLEGDLIYESKSHAQQQQKQHQILPKLVRVNMSMPIMGETVNVIELTIRQNQMDEQILGALKLVQNTKFNSQSVSKVVDTFKSSVEKQQQQQNNNNKQVEADLTIKVDGCTIVYLSVDDIKASSGAIQFNSRNSQKYGQHERQTRSIYNSESIIEEIIEFLKRQPISFNRGFNVNINERLAKVLDVEANILAGLRFESRAASIGAKRGDFELTVQMEPRFGFEAVVGPAKVSSKKLLQRVSSKSAIGMRLRFKRDELVDVELELPMNTMELFTVESQLVEKSRSVANSYTYLPESIYGQEDIYASYPIYSGAQFGQKLAKRSIMFPGNSKKSIMGKLIEGKQVSETFESSEEFARTTGLRGKLRVAVAPKDMGVFVSAMVDKYEPSMQGYRVKIEKVARQADLKQYQVTLSTPGSRIDRTMTVRIAKQTSPVRTLVKAEFQSARIAFAHTIELVHEQQRQYSLKTELVARNGQQWRHALECGIVSGGQSLAGRLAHFAYKPYLQIDSTYLKRPVQLQGQIAYQQSPKAVISYELKCATTGDFVQGKLIVDSRDNNKHSNYRRRSAGRRSMESPIELLMSMDVTLTNELIAQIQQRTLKVHNMADWSSQKYAMEADTSVIYKNQRKANQETQMVASAKVNEQEQIFTVERKSPNDERKNFAVRLISQVRPTGHQMEFQCRHNENNRAQLKSYKHKVEVQKVAQNKYASKLEVELIDTERAMNEKISGRAIVQNERKQKALDIELTTGGQLAKVKIDLESMHKVEAQLQLQGARFQHKTELRNNQRQFVMQSRTEDKQAKQSLVKMLVEVQKPVEEIKLVIEVPVKEANIAADLKLTSGKRSSLAVQTGRFASQAEFSFQTVARPFIQNSRLFQNNLRFRTHLKDLVQKQAYWLDSAINAADLDKETSFVRLDSPIYRADFEFEPRESLAKFGTFARSKRSLDHYDSIYSNKESAFNSLDSLTASLADKLNLGQGKLWMLRSIVSTPYGREQLKKEARRALFQYADRRQNQQHQFKWAPEEQRLSMDLLREPNVEFGARHDFGTSRAKAQLSTAWTRPSTLSLESDWMNVEGELKPLTRDDDEDEESYARFTALSRHPRSSFKKHESEFRYNKRQGYKAAMKHEDAQNKKHSWQMESDVEPSKYAKMSMNSEKHGKASWEHKWRKEQHKRASDQEPVYKNKFALMSEGPAHNKWQHETSFDWEEPVSMLNRYYNSGRQQQQRHRRSYDLDQDQTNYGIFNSIYAKVLDAGRYSPVDYLKHTSARLQSQQQLAGKIGEQLYKLDFDYKPHQNYARLDVGMPKEMLHSSELEIKPAEQLYKFQSKLYNRLTKEPSYDLIASTKPFGLATAEQEPVFVNDEHPMLERPISKESLAYTLFKQPMKLDYSDKYGRKLNLDYDQAPSMVTKFAGLRQKRAAVFYKDAGNDFEHTSTYDFYPESLMGQMKPSFYAQQKQQQQQKQFGSQDVAFKTETKYGPVVVRADSGDETIVVALESPVIKAKLIGETGANMRQLYKVELDNKSQRVQLSKLVREAPASIRDNKLVKKFVRKFDSGRFEHETELLVSLVEQIFKVKSATKLDSRPTLVIEGEWNAPQNKAYAKVNGDRVDCQAAIDLVRKSGELVVDIDDKRTVHHVTRLVRISDKFYTLESVTTHKSRPLFKLMAKLSAMIFDTEHLFASRRYLEQRGQPEHVSTFEAIVYEPKEYQVRGQFDCDKKEARLIFKDAEEEKQQETLVRFDDQTETIFVDARLSSQHEGQIYAAKAKIDLPGLYQAYECQSKSASCQSELIYMDKSGNYSAKYVPGELISVSGPRTKQTINLAGYYY